MRMAARFTILSIAFSVSTTFFLVDDASAQRRRTDRTAPQNQQNDTPSVVVLPESARPKIDTALIAPIPRQKRRRFEVKVVPAAPPGRSRQEIMYTDSLIHRTQPPR
jgi:hypothetical protein